MAGPNHAYDFGRAPFEVPNEPDRHTPDFRSPRPPPQYDLSTSDEDPASQGSYGPVGRDYKPTRYPLRDSSADSDGGGDGKSDDGLREEAVFQSAKDISDMASGEYAENKHLLDDDGPRPSPAYHQMQPRNPPLRKAVWLRERYRQLRRAAVATRAVPDSHQLWVAVDLDGTLLSQDPLPFSDSEPPLGSASDEAKQAMQRLLDAGARVSVYTARFGDPNMSPAQITAMRQKIAEHLDRQGVAYTDIWLGRKPRAHAFIDDRAYRFEGEWGNIVDQILSAEASDSSGPPDATSASAQPADADREASTLNIGPRAGLTADFLDQRSIPPNTSYGRKFGETGPREQFDPAGLEAFDKRRNY